MQKIVLTLGLVCILTEGCSVLKKSSVNDLKSEDSTGLITEKVIKNNLSSKDFYISKVTVSIKQENKTTRFSASIKSKSNDSLLVSVRSNIGLEISRILLTNDTLMINDRINKELLVGSLKNWARKYGLSTELKYLLLGDLIISENKILEQQECINGFKKVKYLSEDDIINYLIDCKRGKIEEAVITGNENHPQTSLKYSDFSRIDSISIPRKINIQIADNNISVKLRIEKYTRDWSGQIVFKPGNGYVVRDIK